MCKRWPLLLAVLLAITLTIVPGVSAAGQESSFTVVGLVYEDQNADGAYGLNASGVEASITDVPVNLYIDNAPYNILGSEDKLLESQLSNDKGYVVFRDLLPGYYLINITVPTGYIATAPVTQAVAVGGDAMGAVVEWTFGLTERSNMPVHRFLPVITQ